MVTLDSPGLSISQSSTRLRNYAAIEKARLRILAGWFLRIGDFEHKYKLAYHLYDAAEHVTWLRDRLKEMRAGNPNASVRPELQNLLEQALHAPDDTSFLVGFYGVLTRGDPRSQLFADQDWSDEINHVRYGSKWTDYLLQDDYREVRDIIEEVKEHLSKLRGEPVTDINAPF